MQYILTEEEYKALKAEQSAKLGLSERKLQKLCTEICNAMPVDWGWSKHRTPEPWGCIIDKDGETDPYWYCDSCPVQEICPYKYKQYSK